MMKTVHIVAGARPNFVKAGPIYHELSKLTNVEPLFVNTRQHNTGVMNDHVFKSAGLPNPHYDLGEQIVDSGVPKTCSMILAYDGIVKHQNRPDLIVSIGDTDAAFTAAYVGKKNGIPVAHVEAGVRSGEDSPEEQNRKMVDSISDLLLAPTREAAFRLERCYKKQGMVGVSQVGNVMIDALKRITEKDKHEWVGQEYESCDVLVTIHRPLNTDNHTRLRNIFQALTSLDQSGIDVFFPMHPRVLNCSYEILPTLPKYCSREPLGYEKFLKTLSRASLVITDSGGVQAEAAYFGTPCLLVRRSTGWTNLVVTGAVVLVEPEYLYGAAYEDLQGDSILSYAPEEIGWDGTAGSRIASAIAIELCGR